MMEERTMAAARMYGRNEIRIERVPIPVPGEGEILVKVASAAICGTDVRMITYGSAGIDESHPRILGHELAGTIAEIGPGVKGYRTGQRVAVAPNMGCGICDTCVKGNGHLCPDYKALGINLDGGFAQYCLIPREAVRGGNVCLLEDGVSFDEAAVNEPLSCVYNGFEQARIHPGDLVLVVGAGPIGLMHCALALMAGAVVFLNDLSMERLAEAKKLYPAIRLIAGDLKEGLMSGTRGKGADVVITACPVPAVQSQALELAALGGRIIFFGGIAAEKEPVPINTNLIHYKQLLVSGTTRASLIQYRRTLAFISEGVLDVKSMITAHFPLEQFPIALEKAHKGEGLKNVIVFE